MAKKPSGIKIIRSDGRAFSQGYGLSQGYQGLYLHSEQSRLNQEWGTRDADCNRILSPAAILHIKAGEREGRFEGRAGRMEPPYMAPSADPMQYSKVRRTLTHIKTTEVHCSSVVLAVCRLCYDPHPLCWMQSWGLLHKR